MNCKSCNKDLTAYLDGELDQAGQRLVEGHTEGCPSCFKELESLRQSYRIVEAHVCEIEPRPETWNNLAAKLSAERTAQRPAGTLHFLVYRRWMPAAALAASIIIGIGIWGLWHYRRSEHELNQYMNEYVDRRNSQEEVDHSRGAGVKSQVRTADAQYSEASDNPFVDVNAGETDNPFRSEAQ